MPIDILSMTRDPEFTGLSAQDQRQLILRAKQMNTGPAPAPVSVPAAAPSAFPWGGGTEGTATPDEAEASLAILRDRVARGVADMPPSALVIDIEKTSPPAGAANAANGPRTQEEWDAMLEPLRLELEQGTRGISELLVPMGSAAAAYKLGRALAPRLGALGRIAGPVFEAGGALLGRRANIQLGYEEPSTAGDIAAAALPLAARGALTGVRTLAENAQFHGAMWRGRSTPLTGLRKLARAGIPGVAIGTLLSTLMGHSQVHWAVGGSFALLRFLLDHAAETPWGYQVLRQVLKGGQALSGPALSALLQVGRIKGQETLQQIQRPGQAPDTWDIAYPPTTDQTPDTWDTPYPPAAGR